MLLHTVNKSPYQHQALNSCAEFCTADDALILIEDGVYAINHPDLALVHSLGTQVFAIEADVKARGLTTLFTRASDQYELVDYDRFVALCVEYSQQKSWS
ncbi:MAG: sulfurtransferase complex subunit TusB [bacterium]|nr:sulfurtransferase complex subunit TusB [Gammaproteobacteria bacterium]HIL96167.1 sulfurtransferase complex subunit TusB [Pseudomonadales bacterium]